MKYQMKFGKSPHMVVEKIVVPNWTQKIRLYLFENAWT